MQLPTRTAEKLAQIDPARAALAAKLVKYLNNLEGAVDAGWLTRDVELLEQQERFLSARIDNL